MILRQRGRYKVVIALKDGSLDNCGTYKTEQEARKMWVKGMSILYNMVVNPKDVGVYDPVRKISSKLPKKVKKREIKSR
jgi:hypothetical protein